MLEADEETELMTDAELHINLKRNIVKPKHLIRDKRKANSRNLNQIRKTAVGSLGIEWQ